MAFRNLIEILEQRSKLTDKGVTFIESSSEEVFLSYKEMYHQVLKVLSFLQIQGLQPKDELVFQLDDNKTFIIVFWACIIGGIIPVPLTLGRNSDQYQKIFTVWKILNNPYLIILTESLDKLKKHADLNDNYELFNSIRQKVINVESIYSSDRPSRIYQPSECDIAYVQFSSGSTGNPKGVILTHKNLIANIKAISKASSYFENDSKLSWMPITHDMGLIGFHLCPLFLGMNHYLIPTNLFIRRPSLWLEKASQHKVSILCSPNFGYQYLLKHYDESFDYKWNLSHVRIIYNGAEPISEGICHDFLNALSCYGLNKTSMCPVYGLAEASVAVSISKIDKEVISVNVDRNNLTVGSTITNNLGSESSISFINVGVAIDNCSLRITDVEGKLSAAKINLLQNLR